MQNFFLIIAVLIRVLSNPLANVAQKQLTAKSVHPFFVNHLAYLLLSVACLFCMPWIGLPQLTTVFWLYALLDGLSGALGNAFLVKAVQHGDLSVLGPINAYKSVVGVLTGAVLLAEWPHAVGLLGMALIIWGSYFVLGTTEEKFTLRLLRRKDIQYRIWALILTAIEAVFIKKIIVITSASFAFVSWCVMGTLFSAMLLPANGVSFRSEWTRTKKHLSKVGYLVLCLGAMQLTTNFVLERMPVGLALSLFQLSAIISVWLGYKIFAEQGLRQKLIGSAIMVAGSALIIWFSNG